MVLISCEVCGEEFGVRPYRKDTARFCSPECGGRYRFTVDNPSQKPNSHLNGNKHRQGKRPANAFKSEDVRGDKGVNWRGGLVANPCDWCGKPVRRDRNQVNRNEHFFCDRDCFSNWKSQNWGGENSPAWRGGHSNYYGPDWKRQARLARKRDGESCQVCGVNNPQRKLDVHHIIRFGDFDNHSEANDLGNLITVCHSCHMVIEYCGAQQGMF